MNPVAWAWNGMAWTLGFFACQWTTQVNMPTILNPLMSYTEPCGLGLGPKPLSQNAGHCPNAGTGIWVNADLDRHFDWHLDIHLYQ